MKLILVDDNKEFRESMKIFLETKLKHQVIASFSDGKSFCDSYKQYNPDIILMDISMPEMDGYEATKVVNWEKSHIKIIAVTMFKNKAYLQKLIEFGFKACVLKTNVFNELGVALEKVYNGEQYFNDILD